MRKLQTWKKKQGKKLQTLKKKANKHFIEFIET